MPLPSPSRLAGSREPMYRQDRRRADTYLYNARNQLTTAKQGSTILGAFVYDGVGRRVQKTVASVVSKFVYDGWNTAQEKDSKNKIAFNELNGLSLDQVFSRTPASGTASYLLTDPLGSTVGLADTNGVIQTSYTYEPYGKTTSSGTLNTNPFGFTGRENDSTGSLALYNHRIRSYSPALQRFLTEDPIGFASGAVNLYAYVGNSPTNLIDPLGLEEREGGCGTIAIDVNVSLLFYDFGVVFDACGAHGYVGVGVGLGASATVSPPVGDTCASVTGSVKGPGITQVGGGVEVAEGGSAQLTARGGAGPGARAGVFFNIFPGC